MARDEFSLGVKSILAYRAGFRCSKPSCRTLTAGPSFEHSDAYTNIGVAAHITAAAPGGPRFDAAMTPEVRKSASNGLWLCQTHAKEIDSDTTSFPVDLLKEWKRHAELDARALLGRPISEQSLEVAAEATLHRSPDDTLVVAGTTNLPNGTKLMISLYTLSGDETIGQAKTVVNDGMFAHSGFKNQLQPHPNAWFRVEITAYFNLPWGQLPSVLEIVGEDGSFLTGPYSSSVDREFPEEGRWVHAIFECVAPPLYGQPLLWPGDPGEAIQMVRQAVLTVQGRASATSVEESLAFRFSLPGVRLKQRGEWSVRPLPNGSLLVTLPFWNGDLADEATWHVVPASGEVRYWNIRAKQLSWTRG